MAPVAIPGTAEREYAKEFPEGMDEGIPQGVTQNKSGRNSAETEAVKKFLSGEEVLPPSKEKETPPEEKPTKQELKPEEKAPPEEGEEKPPAEEETVEIEGVKVKAADVKAALKLKKTREETEGLKKRLAVDPEFRALIKATLQQVEPSPPKPEPEPELPAEVAEALGGDERVVKFFLEQLKKTREVEKQLHETNARMYANQFKETLSDLSDAHGIPMPTVEEAKAIGQAVLMGENIVESFNVKMASKIEAAKVKAEAERKRDAVRGAGEAGTGSPTKPRKSAPPIPGDFKKSLEKAGLDWNKIHESDVRRKADAIS